MGCGRIARRGRNARFGERMSHLVELAPFSFMDASNHVMIC